MMYDAFRDYECFAVYKMKKVGDNVTPRSETGK